jgi:uncharacterized protein YdeI (YjbR/CyaY-like superfamily)
LRAACATRYHGFMNQLFCRTSSEWRSWLKANHGSVKEVWLVFLKGANADQELTYEQSLDEALCYGWIDSLIKRIDDERYARKFTPRKPVSKWSEVNKRKVTELERQGRLKAPGKAVVAAARENGCWDGLGRLPILDEPPPELAKALAGNMKARDFFMSLAPSYRTRYIMWIASAKRPEIRLKRAQEVVQRLADGMKPGLK